MKGDLCRRPFLFELASCFSFCLNGRSILEIETQFGCNKSSQPKYSSMTRSGAMNYICAAAN